ncbi:cation:proton antiporter [Amycolatopsis suaedae]|uniref:Sodium:proton antiporter n=1 Tax=Amycolatopsis suaedae TaxID=2510978 RepID=A0A4Q7J9V2_9PSEU|nr:cation:proton antiporter [Amycolatopsis suaedae]RZQ64570.1 sodium:proton antiporter [Amycolatopsis suaedae]
MAIAAAFGLALLVAVLLSALAERSALSLPLVFLITGFVIGHGGFGLVTVSSSGDLVRRVADVALFTVLFTDGMRALAPRDRTLWAPPIRALLIGMPLTAAVITLLAWGLTDLPLAAALLLGVILSPTDPVLVSGIVRRSGVPRPLRHALNVESGVNDGLALPAVVVLIAVLGSRDTPDVGTLLGELAGGAALGAVGAAVLAGAARLPVLAVHQRLRPLAPVAVATACYGTAHLLHLNPYLAAFVAGAMVAKTAPQMCGGFQPLGDHLAELMKFLALLVFGALLTGGMLADVPAGGYVVALLALLLARPASLLLSFLGSEFARRQRLAASWFGPKGLASVVYGLYVVQAGIPYASTIFAVVALCVVLSVIAHTTTDVLVARRFRQDESADAGAGPGQRPP